MLERAAETIQELRVQNDRLLVQGGDKLQGGSFSFTHIFPKLSLNYKVALSLSLT